MEASSQFQAPAALSPEKEFLMPIENEVGWAPESAWTMWRRDKSFALAGNRSPSAQPVARRCIG
jgi:hypothetical protein